MGIRPPLHLSKQVAEPPSPIFGPCPLWPNSCIDQDGTWHGGGPCSRPHCARWGPSSLPKKGDRAPSPIFDTFLLWPNGCIHQDVTWYGRRSQPRRLCVIWGPSPSPKKGRSPQFSAHVYCGQTAGCTKMPLGSEVGLSPGHFALDGDPALSPKRGQRPLPNSRPTSIVAKRLDGSRWHLAWRWVLVQAILC